VNLVLTIGVGQKCLAILLFTGVAAPIAGLLFRHVGGSWDSIGKGPFAIEQQLPTVPRYFGRAAPPIDPAIQAAEVRQMLEAKAERRKRRGEAPLDVEAEATRLLAPSAARPGAEARQDGELRAEVRQLILTRNERRMRKGLAPLDIEVETDRQLDDFIGSS
jgi:hypothetical protein